MSFGIIAWKNYSNSCNFFWNHASTKLDYACQLKIYHTACFFNSFCLYLDNYHYLYTYLSSAVECFLSKIFVEILFECENCCRTVPECLMHVQDSGVLTR